MLYIWHYGYFSNIFNCPYAPYSILFSFGLWNTGCIFAARLPDIGRKEAEADCPVLSFSVGCGMACYFFYEFAPVLFVWLNIACLVSFILPSIFFYRIVRYLTRLGQPEVFPLLHYLLPSVLTAVMLVWSLFVPLGVALEIVTSKAQVFPAGYEAYACFFTTKPLLRVIFGLTYSCLPSGYC